MFKLSTVSAFVLTFAAFIPAASAQFDSNYEKFDSYVMCRNQNLVRTLRINRNEQQGGCKTLYTKAGVDKVVGTAKNMTSCQTILNNVKGNLEKGYWKCDSVDQARIYRSMKTPNAVNKRPEQPFDD